VRGYDAIKKKKAVLIRAGYLKNKRKGYEKGVMDFLKRNASTQ